LIEIGSKTAEKNYAQTNRQANRHYENNGHLAVNQKLNVILDSFYGQPIGTLVDSTQGNPDVRATGNGAQWCAG